MKEILIINGSGGVGKDTFVDLLGELIPVIHESIVNPTKALAKQIGWDGSKSEKDRKFLAELKSLIDMYNGYNYSEMEKLMTSFLNGELECELLCIDMREKFQIEKAKKEFGAKTVLVTRQSVKRITSNHADADVFNTTYDYHINNDGTLEDLKLKAKEFKEQLENEHKKAN